MLDPWFGADEKTGWLWVEDAKANAVWYDALTVIDRRGDKKPLIKLLQSGQPVPSSVSFYIGDLLDRYELKQPKSRPSLPAYVRTPEQIKLVAAVIEVHRLVHQDEVPFEDALKRIATKSKLSKKTLRSAYFGRHGGLRRAVRRWHRP